METKAPIMNKPNDNICNGGLHGYSEYIAQYSRWFNVCGKLSDRKQSELKTPKLMFLCLQYNQRNFQNLKKTYFVTRKS